MNKRNSGLVITGLFFLGCSVLLYIAANTANAQSGTVIGVCAGVMFDVFGLGLMLYGGNGYR